MTSAKPHIWFQNCTGCVGLCSVWYCNTIKDTQFHTLLNTPCISYIFVESSEEGSILPTQIPTISHHISSQLFCSDKGQLSHIFWALSLSYVNLLTSAQRRFLEVLSFFFFIYKIQNTFVWVGDTKRNQKNKQKKQFSIKWTVRVHDSNNAKLHLKLHLFSFVPTDPFTGIQHSAQKIKRWLDYTIPSPRRKEVPHFSCIENTAGTIYYNHNKPQSKFHRII